MATANRPYGRILKGHRNPYGTLVGAGKELKAVYYGYGYLHDEDLPEFPCPPYEEKAYEHIEDEVYLKEVAAHVEQMLETLTPREAKVLRMRFGVELQCDYTLEEVGVAFQLTRERIRQIEAKAIRKMKRPERHEILRHVWQPEYYYETTEEKRLKTLSIQKKWREAKDRQDREEYLKAFRAGNFLPPKKYKLWHELKPALVDAPWVANLKVEKPDMYQELKELVSHIWEEHAPDIWKNYTKENI